MLRIMLAVVFVCAGASTGWAETHVVSAYTMSFSPETIVVAPGDTIRWEYVSGYPHTVTSGSKCKWDGLFDGELNGSGDVFEWVVPGDAPVSIPYFCMPHCAMGMVGQIYVAPGRVVLGPINFSAVYDLEYYPDGYGEYLGVVAGDGEFTLCFEVEDEPAVVMLYGNSELYSVSTGATEPISGGYTLLDPGKYVLAGGAGMMAGISWDEPDDSDHSPFISASGGNISLHADEGRMMFRADEASTFLWLSFEGEGEVLMTPIGAVSSATLSLPANGEEGLVTLTGSHSVLIEQDPIGVLILDFNLDDDSDCPEDVNGDDLVNVSDLLQVIGAWGACP